jgi:hypothetical protein
MKAGAEPRSSRIALVYYSVPPWKLSLSSLTWVIKDIGIGGLQAIPFNRGVGTSRPDLRQIAYSVESRSTKLQQPAVHNLARISHIVSSRGA